MFFSRGLFFLDIQSLLFYFLAGTNFSFSWTEMKGRTTVTTKDRIKVVFVVFALLWFGWALISTHHFDNVCNLNPRERNFLPG